MRRHVQQPGIRQWAGEDLLELQSEPLKALDGFFEEYGPCVIKGCHIINNGDETYNLSPGLVALSGTDNNGNATFKVVPFSGVEAMPLPVYLTLTYSVVERPYMDGQVKPIAYDYRAAVSAVKPEAGDYMELSADSIPRFVDAIQNAGHRFFTDTEREKLQSIEKNANNYIHPNTHPAEMIAESDTRCFVTSEDRNKLSGEILATSQLVSDPTVGGTDKPASAEAVKTVNDEIETIQSNMLILTSKGYDFNGWVRIADGMRMELSSCLLSIGTPFLERNSGGCVISLMAHNTTANATITNKIGVCSGVDKIRYVFSKSGLSGNAYLDIYINMYYFSISSSLTTGFVFRKLADWERVSTEIPSNYNSVELDITW